METKNKCEAQKFVHAWRDITPNIVYATNPPQYPPRQEECPNCGLKRTFLKKTEECIEYSDGKDRPSLSAGGITYTDLTDFDPFGSGTASVNKQS